MQVYFDGSGDFAKGDFLCLCGYAATGKEWEAFCADWNKKLAKHKIESVHMAEFMRREGAYKKHNWSIEERDGVLGEYIDLILKYVRYGIGLGFDLKHFRTMQASRERETKDPYYFCFRRAMEMMLPLSRATQSRVSVVFDDHEKYSADCYKFWKQLRTRIPEMKRRVSSITFADDIAFPPLQGADILAWSTNRTLNQMEAGVPLESHIARLVGKTPAGFDFQFETDYWDKARLEKEYVETARHQ